ncbi:hypothetical protein GCM10028790_36760 [Micromonospora taraxaci]
MPGGYPLLVPSLLYLARLVLAGKGRGVGAVGIQSLGHLTSLRRASPDLTCATSRSRTVSAMSDAHLTDRSLDGSHEPVELSEEPIQLSTRDSGGDPDERSGGWSRRRKIGWAIALVVGLAGAGVLGVGGWRVAQQKDTQLTSPDRVAGLTRDDSERAKSTADYLRSGLAANIELDRSFGTVYRDPADDKRSVLIFGGTTLLWQPERDLDSLFRLMSDETGSVNDLRESPAGDLGGVMKCGSTSGEGGDFAVCGWADHGSVVMAMFPGRSVTDAGGLMRNLRSEMQTRG